MLRVLSPERDLRSGHQCLKGIVCLSLGVLAVGGLGFSSLTNSKTSGTGLQYPAGEVNRDDTSFSPLS